MILSGKPIKQLEKRRIQWSGLILLKNSESFETYLLGTKKLINKAFYKF